jgi:hypothetical protein
MSSEGDESRQLRDRAFDRWEILLRNWRRRARRSRRMSKVFSYGSALLTVATAAMSGIPAVPRWWIVVVSAGAALAITLLSVTKSHDQWVSAREVQNHLYAERFLFEQGAGPYEESTGDERTRLFSVRITEIGMSGHTSWAGHVEEAAAAVKPAESP